MRANHHHFPTGDLSVKSGQSRLERKWRTLPRAWRTVARKYNKEVDIYRKGENNIKIKANWNFEIAVKTLF